MLRRVHPRIAFLPLALLLPACPTDKNDTADTSTSASTGDSGSTDAGTVGMSSTPTTGDATSATADPTTDLPGTTTTADPTTTTADPTTTPADPCMALCDRLDECMVFIDRACFEGCSGDLAGSEGECLDATIDWLMCLEGLDCPQLKATFEDDAPSACDPQLDQLEVECSDGACRFSGGGGDDQCEASVSCPDEPLLEMKCDSVTCQCFSAGEPTDQCPADGICMNIEALQDKSLACCGF